LTGGSGDSDANGIFHGRMGVVNQIGAKSDTHGLALVVQI